MGKKRRVRGKTTGGSDGEGAGAEGKTPAGKTKRDFRGRKNSKRVGELAELAFMYKAASLGFCVLKPYGDSERYDIAVESDGRFVRVQVKGSNSLQYGAYLVNIQRHANGVAIPYDPSEIDFVVAYVMPEDRWFVIPIRALKGKKSARVCLHGDPRHGRFGEYWDAWGLMRRASEGL